MKLVRVVFVVIETELASLTLTASHFPTVGTGTGKEHDVVCGECCRGFFHVTPKPIRSSVFIFIIIS